MERAIVVGRAISAIVFAVALGCGASDGGGEATESQTPDGMLPGSAAGAPIGGAAADTEPSDDASPTDAIDPPGTAGGAGTSAQPGPTVTAPPMTAGTSAFPDARGGCPELDSGFADDHACIAPPAPGEGMQIHVGPADYDDPNEINKFIFEPGMETSQCWTFHTPNTEDVYYNNGAFVISGRAGTHHIINTMYRTELQDGGWGACADGGTGTNGNILDTLPGASKAYMERRPVAPENASVGRLIPANTPSQGDAHYFNFTDAPILREFWINIYFVPSEQVKEEAHLIRGMGGLEWSILGIAPSTDRVYQYSAPITQDGRIIELLGHYHAHGKRFTAYLKRASGEQLKVFEMYDYLDPLVFGYDSITQNPEFSDAAGGAYTGILEVEAGDTLQWECHISNDSTATLRYTNNVNTGEMCNLWGASVGPTLNAVLFAETPF